MPAPSWRTRLSQPGFDASAAPLFRQAASYKKEGPPRWPPGYVHPWTSRLRGREVEQIEQVVERRRVRRNIRVVRGRSRIREVIPAALGDCRQAPVALDELQDRHVVGVLVR